MRKPDVIIILGGGTDGTLKPVLYTKERIKAFSKLYKKYFGTPIIVSGGYSTWMKFKPKYREADVMQNYLIKQDIPKDLVLIERKSRDTIGNAYFSKQIIKKFPKWKNLLIVTTKGHDARSRWTFKRVLGEKYQTTFFGVPTKLPSFRNNPNRKKYERFIRQFVNKEFFRSMKDGDDVMLGKLMKKYHPAHSRSKEAKQLAQEIMKAKLKYLGYTELKVQK
ncbi:MAG: YdcF family protein [Patescibacteria group bacterium]